MIAPGRYRATRVIAAPPAAVWAVLSDVASWTSWQDFDTVRRVPDPEGPVGPVGDWDLQSGRIRTRIRITDVQADHRLVYEALRLVGARRYRAEVELTVADGGTRVTWDGSFVPAVPGTGWLLGRSSFRLVEANLGRLAEVVAAGGAPPAGGE